MIDDTLKLLSEKSNHGKVSWKFQNNNTLETTVNSLLIYFTETNPDQSYNLRLMNGSGIRLDDKTYSSTEPLFGEARNLFKSTTRNILQPEKSIHDLNSYLKSL